MSTATPVLAAAGETVSPDEIRRALAVLFDPGQVVELRALDVSTPAYRGPHTESGYFDDHERLAEAAAKLSPCAAGVYVTLNQINPALLARAANRVRVVGKKDPLTSDLEVKRRLWLPIDCDAVRPAGVSSTDQEHEAALERARQIRDTLCEAGWPGPVLADSGNGGHLLYCVDLPADDGGLVQKILAALALRFEGAGVKIDQTVFNPARIWKLYGTRAGKGDDVPSRPHRMARLLEVADELVPVATGQLEELAAALPEPEPAVWNSTGRELFLRPGGHFDVEAFLRKHNIGFADKEPWNGGFRWVLDTCVWNPDHSDGAAVVVQFSDGKLGAKCHHNGCFGKRWRDLRAAVDAEYRICSASPQGSRSAVSGSRAALPEIHSARTPLAAAESELRFRTAREIGQETSAEVPWRAKLWLVDGCITELDGKIKSAGKTTWMLALGRAIVDGSPFMGEPTQQSAVVYLTEQPPRSLREALRRAGLLERDDFHVLYWHETRGISWPDIVAAAVQKARECAARVLMVDTLAQFAGLKGDEENSSGPALEAMQPLQQAAAEDSLAILLSRHERKSGGEVGDSGRGSSAYAGTVDIVLQLKRPEGNSRPTMRVLRALSRFDETPDSLAIELTGDSYRALGAESVIAVEAAKVALLDVASGTADKALELKELLDAAEGVKRTIGQAAIKELLEAGLLRRVGEGKKGDPYRYWRPAEPSDPSKNDSAVLKEEVAAESILRAPHLPDIAAATPSNGVCTTAEIRSAATSLVSAAERKSGAGVGCCPCGRTLMGREVEWGRCATCRSRPA